MNIRDIAKQLVTPGKGILAADESTTTIAKRFEKANIENTEDNRRLYRQLLFTAQGMENYISGVILFDETLRQSTTDEVPFPALLRRKGVLPGIKVDQGVLPFGDKQEMLTKGLEGLADRLKEYRELEAAFTKWRAVISIGADIPTNDCIRENAKALAQFALTTQRAEMVPIVEPEVLMDGDHTAERCAEVTANTLTIVFEELASAGVDFEGMLLKPNMVIAGSEVQPSTSKETVAQMTIACLQKTVPPSVPGIVFLSGGQSDEQAALNLNEMNKTKGLLWQLSFSFGRGLQQAALTALAGDIHNEVKQRRAQDAFLHSALQCSRATQGLLSD